MSPYFVGLIIPFSGFLKQSANFEQLLSIFLYMEIKTMWKCFVFHIYSVVINQGISRRTGKENISHTISKFPFGVTQSFFIFAKSQLLIDQKVTLIRPELSLLNIRIAVFAFIILT